MCVCGTVVLTASKAGDTVGLTDEDIAKYRDAFAVLTDEDVLARYVYREQPQN